MDFEIVSIVRLLVSLALGVLIGSERERRAKAAGVKTHALISLGSCLFVLIGLTWYEADMSSDLLRLFQGIATGVGFVGAGAIMKQGEHIEGVTTAACIWVTAAVGMAIGAGQYLLGGVTAVLVFLFLRIMYRFNF